jgi:hypothetical protein
MKKYSSLEEMLTKHKHVIKVFRSGGGLRVAYSKPRASDEKGYYGESYDLGNALRIILDDVKAGGRAYKKVYGPIEPHYLTGAYATENDPVDRWVCAGQDLLIYEEAGKFFALAQGKLQWHTPKEIVDKASGGTNGIYWKFKDSPDVYMSSCYTFANLSTGCSTKTVEKNSEDDIFRDVEYAGEGNTVNEALAKLAPKILFEISPEFEYVTRDHKLEETAS